MNYTGFRGVVIYVSSNRVRRLKITSVTSYAVKFIVFSADVDTTMVLDLYPDANMMRVCLTGDDFRKEYGHNMSDDDPMMGNNWTWQEHMSHEHKPNDKHYGHFDMNANFRRYL